MRYDDYLSPQETRLIDTLKGKSRMDKDQIIFEYERTKDNGNIVRNDRTGTGTVRTVTE